MERRAEKMKFFNQYSAVWMAALLLVIVGIFLFRRKPKWPQFLTFGLFAAALLTAWIFLHPRQVAQANDAASIQASIGQGTPVLLEFQSPY
jgi:amino acid transporter